MHHSFPTRRSSERPVQGGEPIAIFRTANGGVHALVDKFPHKVGPLSQGIVHDTSVTCPLHNWRISLITGEALGEDKGCTRLLPVQVDAGPILLSPAEALPGVVVQQSDPPAPIAAWGTAAAPPPPHN